MASITLLIRELVIGNPEASVDELLKLLASAGHEAKRDTVATIRSDTLATMRLMQDIAARNAASGAPALPAAPAKKKAKKRPPSRSQRWSDAASKAVAACADLEAALEELKEIQGEFSDWKDNLPENLASSALGEKLETVCGIDLEGCDVSEIQSVVEEAEGADLPLGFGRD